MNLPVHAVDVIAGSNASRKDRVYAGMSQAVANAAGGGAGLAVTTTVTFPSGALPANYSIAVDPHQDATWFTGNRTATSFDVTLTPRLAANTLAAGTFDVIILG